MPNTPGPWTTEDAPTSGAFMMAGCEVVCYAARKEDAPTLAAALEMLEALKLAEDAVMFVRDQFLVHSAPHHDGLRGWTALEETIHAAIAKTTGAEADETKEGHAPLRDR